MKLVIICSPQNTMHDMSGLDATDKIFDHTATANLGEGGDETGKDSGVNTSGKTLITFFKFMYCVSPQ